MDSKRVAGIVLLCTACLVGFLISTAYYSIQEEDRVPYWWRGYRMTGNITDISGGTITIKIETGEEKKFKIDALTKITLLGSTGLIKGTPVRVTYKTLNDPTHINLARLIREIPAPLPGTSETMSPSPGASPLASPAASPTQTSPSSQMTDIPNPSSPPGTGTPTAQPSPGEETPPEKSEKSPETPSNI